MAAAPATTPTCVAATVVAVRIIEGFIERILRPVRLAVVDDHIDTPRETSGDDGTVLPFHSTSLGAQAEFLQRIYSFHRQANRATVASMISKQGDQNA